MDIIRCIDIFYTENVDRISKFDLYKILKQNDKNFSYYRLKKTFTKLKDTGVLKPTPYKNEFIFNKVRKIRKPPFILEFE